MPERERRKTNKTITTAFPTFYHQYARTDTMMNSHHKTQKTFHEWNENPQIANL